MCKPDAKAAENSAHFISSRGGEPECWHWQGGGWAKQPNSRWITAPGPMSALGWRYVGPADQAPGAA